MTNDEIGDVMRATTISQSYNAAYQQAQSPEFQKPQFRKMTDNSGVLGQVPTPPQQPALGSTMGVPVINYDDPMTNVVFGEASGLRGMPGDRVGTKNLHDARSAASNVYLNLPAPTNSKRGGFQANTALNPVTRQNIERANNEGRYDDPSYQAFMDSRAAVHEAIEGRRTNTSQYPKPGDPTAGANHWYVYDPRSNRIPTWASDRDETSRTGELYNLAGGGDVARGATVTVRTYKDPYFKGANQIQPTDENNNQK